jgi:hypothetical protein
MGFDLFIFLKHDVSKFCGDYHVVFALNESGVCFEDRHKALEL